MFLALALLLAGSAVPQASAATVVAPNACRYSYDASWHDQDLTFDVAATPNPAGPGAGFSVGGDGANRAPAAHDVAGLHPRAVEGGGEPRPRARIGRTRRPGGVQVVQVPVEFVTTIRTNALGLFGRGRR